MHRRFQLLALWALAVSCSSNTQPSDTQSGEPTAPDQSYINFHAYWSDGTPAIVNVSIYIEFTSSQIYSGSSLPNGDFYSSRKFSVDSNYDIYIHDVPSGQCIDYVLVSFHSNDPWPRSPQNTAEKQVNVGPKDAMNSLADCRP